MKITIQESPVAVEENKESEKDKEEEAKPIKNLSQLLNRNQVWNCKKHDKGLLKAVAQHGFHFLGTLAENDKYGFEDITAENLTKDLTDEIKKAVLGIEPESDKPENDKIDETEKDPEQNELVKIILQKRVEEVCQIYKEQQQ